MALERAAPTISWCVPLPALLETGSTIYIPFHRSVCTGTDSSTNGAEQPAWLPMIPTGASQTVDEVGRPPLNSLLVMAKYVKYP
ncbi:hypothetical protein BX600DRAFT_465527 [Xylariales sp. PMI_506]|nr:hypothetical protein BX600DRAFT_465527 [Xylariales sp. PMI_506]